MCSLQIAHNQSIFTLNVNMGYTNKLPQPYVMYCLIEWHQYNMLLKTVAGYFLSPANALKPVRSVL